MKKELRVEAIRLRKLGYSVKELARLLGVSKGTISVWVRGIELSTCAYNRLQRNYTKGQLASQQSIRKITEAKNRTADDFAKHIISDIKLSKNNSALLCAMLYICEGSKSLSEGVAFTNSNPKLMRTYMSLFRASFRLDEKKFRVRMHLHSYHNETTQTKFWSKVTKIPNKQFQKTYHKPSNRIYKKEGYQGCIQVRYYDTKIVRNLLSIAKIFMERYK
ncbi:MAG TPA: helix-turn-helix domain-containing protein [Candidatus Paceibacterota bacterium]|nr:helix-turn-helix domain-containing protein [Candidatus Paceibacterota bacterium]